MKLRVVAIKKWKNKIKVKAKKTVVECGTFTIKSDGTMSNTELLMDGKPVKGVQKVLLELDCEGKEFFNCKIILGVHGYEIVS